VMDEARYNGLIASVWKRILAAADQIDPDVLDAVATGDMVTLTASSGEKVVVNTQRAVRQIWVAGKSQGIHFSLADDGRWMDDKGKGMELYGWVSECVQALTGEPLRYG
jgi:CyaY protein